MAGILSANEAGMGAGATEIPIPGSRRSIRLPCPCPNCDGDRDDTLAVYRDGTNCFRCGFSETVSEFLSRAGREGISLDQRAWSGDWNVLHPHGQGTHTERDRRVLVASWHRTLVEGPRYCRLDYLYDRGIYHSTIVRQQLGHTGERFVIPLHHGSSPTHLVGWKLRADPRYCDPASVKYLQFSDPKTVMYRPNKGGHPVIFCEGEFDALILAQTGADAITSTGGAGDVAKTCGFLGFKRTVYLATDQDDAGEEAARRLSAIYPTALRMRWSGGNDVSEAIRNSGASPIACVRRWVEAAERL